VAVKTFIMFQNIYFSYECCSFELYIHQRNLKKKITVSTQHNFFQHW